MKHLLGLEGLSAAEITRLLDAAERFGGVGGRLQTDIETTRAEVSVRDRGV